MIFLLLLHWLTLPITSVIVPSFWCVLSRVQPYKVPEYLERVDSAPLVYVEEMESKKQKTAAIIKEKIYLFGVNSWFQE